MSFALRLSLLTLALIVLGITGIVLQLRLHHDVRVGTPEAAGQLIERFKLASATRQQPPQE